MPTPIYEDTLNELQPTTPAPAPEQPAIMVDIETLGSAPHGIPFQAAIVCFDLATGRELWCSEWLINPQDAENCGMKSGVDTCIWWLNQPRNISETIDRACEEGISLEHFCADFMKDYRGLGANDWDTIWARSPSFDLAIIAHAYNCVGYPLSARPWRYYQERDHRTVTELVPKVYKTLIKALAGSVTAPKHDALVDARHQVRTLHIALRWLKTGILPFANELPWGDE